MAQPLAVVSGDAVVGKAHTAYRAYLDHAQSCEDCPKSTFQCGTAAALWLTYREVRG
jgi:hypothetical protein